MSEVLHIKHIFDETGCLNLTGMRGYINGSLNQKERSLAGAHLKECELCAEAIGGIELEPEDAVLLSSLSAMTAHVRAQSGTGNPADQGQNGGGTSAWIWQAAAAVAALLVVTVGVWLVRPNQESLDQSTPGLAMESQKEEVGKPAKESKDLPILSDAETTSKADQKGDGDMVAMSDLKRTQTDEVEDKVREDLGFEPGPFEIMDAEVEEKELDALVEEKVDGPVDNLREVAKEEPRLTSPRQENRKNSAGIASIEPLENDKIASDESLKLNETVAFEDVAEDDFDANVNIGYQTDVYTFDADEATYAGTKNELAKDRDKKSNINQKAKAESEITAKGKTSVSATRSAAAKSLSKAITPPTGIYYDSDNATWSNSQVLQDQAMAEYDVQNYTDAIKSFEEVIKVDPENEDARFYGGVSYFELGLFNNAETHFRFLSEKPESKHFEQAEWYLAEILVRKNELTAAKEMLRKIEKGEGEFKVKAAKRLKEIK